MSLLTKLDSVGDRAVLTVSYSPQILSSAPDEIFVDVEMTWVESDASASSAQLDSLDAAPPDALIEDSRVAWTDVRLKPLWQLQFMVQMVCTPGTTFTVSSTVTEKDGAPYPTYQESVEITC